MAAHHTEPLPTGVYSVTGVCHTVVDWSYPRGTNGRMLCGPQVWRDLYDKLKHQGSSTWSDSTSWPVMDDLERRAEITCMACLVQAARSA